MKILVTGANSYIGTSFIRYMKQAAADAVVEELDMCGEAWKQKDFSGFDAVFHVAGIAHSDTSNVTDETKALYYRVNKELAVETAKKAKTEGVKQFIFMSSAIVFGDSARVGQSKMITKETVPSPANFYGDSKLQAEKGILALADDTFKVVIIRAPMIYGKGSKGNYRMLSKYAKRLPIFPKVENKRSMLYIGNLTEFVRLMIVNREEGVFYPQNAEYVTTYDMVREIAANAHKRVFLFAWLNPLIRLCGKKIGILNKVFGNMTYDMELSRYKERYQLYDFKESIQLTEGKE